MRAPIRRLVRAAALEAFAAAGVDAALVGWENRPVAPPADARPWGEETLRVGPETLEAGGDPRTYVARPLYQLTVQVAVNEGTAELDAICAALTTAFRPGRRLTASANAGPAAVPDGVLVDLVCETVDPGAPAPGVAPGWCACPVRVGLVARRLVAADGAMVPFARFLPPVFRTAPA